MAEYVPGKREKGTRTGLHMWDMQSEKFVSFNCFKFGAMAKRNGFKLFPRKGHDRYLQSPKVYHLRFISEVNTTVLTRTLNYAAIQSGALPGTVSFPVSDQRLAPSPQNHSPITAQHIFGQAFLYFYFTYLFFSDFPYLTKRTHRSSCDANLAAAN